jgi:hypothetical protein
MANISLRSLKLTCGEALAALFNHGGVRGMGYLDPKSSVKFLTVEEAEKIAKELITDTIKGGYFNGSFYIDYLYGRPIKIRFCDSIDVSLYDREYGQGAAEFALFDYVTDPNR